MPAYIISIRSQVPRVRWPLLLGALALWLLLTPSPAAADNHIIYVKPDASGSGDSWTNAADLQTALADATNGDEIWVATGIYTPGSTQTDTFALKNGVALYGGFVGTETQRSQRDWQANPTVLSGDIDDNDTTNVAGIVTDADNITGANAYHVLYLDGTSVAVTASTIIDGVIVTGGQANGVFFPDNVGGGLFCDGGGGGDCSPTLANVTFSGNIASSGGAMYNYAENGTSSPILTNVDFNHNRASTDGGAMFNWGANSGNSSPVLTGVTFTGNTALNGDGGAIFNRGVSGVSSPTLTDVTINGNTTGDDGGGMFNDGTDGVSSPTLTNVTFSGNSATTFGGGMRNVESNPALTNVTLSGNSAHDGGGMYNENSSPTLTNVSFNGNLATGEDGGGMYNNSSSPSLTNVTFTGNSVIYWGGGMLNFNSSPTLTNAIFSGNSALYGGGMYNDNSNPTLTNVTFSGNTAGNDGGGMRNRNGSSPLIQNTVLWDNTAGNSGPTIANGNSSNAPIIRFSLIEGGLPTFSVDGGNNITGNPRFVRAVDCGDDGCGDDPTTPADESANDDYGDLRLQSISPVIDVGDNAAVPPNVTTDLDGAPRIAVYNGFAAIVDLGAYERANATPSFTSSPPTTATEDVLYSYTATTEDDTAGIRPINAEQKPAWLTFTDNADTTAALSGTPTNADVGDHTVVLRAQDAIGASGYQTFTLTVLNTNDPPSFASQPDTSATVGQLYSYAVATNDPDVGDTRTLTALSKPAWLNLTDNGDGTATLTGTPAPGDVGSVDVVLQVEDAEGLNDEQVFTLTVSATGSENSAPSFTSQPDTSAAVGQLYSYAVTTSDPDPGDTRTLTALSKPAWLSLTDHGDGTAALSGTPAADDVGTADVVLQVQDAGGLIANQVFAVVVSSEPITTGGLSGQVTADGTGVPGVTVSVNNDAATRAVSAAAPTAVIVQDVTDAQGTYSFDGLTPGPYTLTFDPPAGFATPSPADVVVEAGKTKTVTTVDLDLIPVDTNYELFIPQLAR